MNADTADKAAEKFAQSNRQTSQPRQEVNQEPQNFLGDVLDSVTSLLANNPEVRKMAGNLFASKVIRNLANDFSGQVRSNSDNLGKSVESTDAIEISIQQIATGNVQSQTYISIASGSTTGYLPSTNGNGKGFGK